MIDIKTPRFTWRKDKRPKGLASIGWNCNNMSLFFGDYEIAVINFQHNIYWYSLVNELIVGDVSIKLESRHTHREALVFSSLDEAKNECKKWITEKIKKAKKDSLSTEIKFR